MRYGVATMDEKLTPEMRKSTAYNLWNSMIGRCYSPSHVARRPSYEQCTVCPEWLIFSNFKAWLGTRDVSGLQLDKDLKYPGNTEYNPQCCVFVPACVNTLLHAPHSDNGLPVGVRIKPKTGKFFASISKRGQDVHLGYFTCANEASAAYRKAKLDIIAEYKKEFSCPDIQDILTKAEKKFR